MKPLIQMVKERVFELYENIAEHFKNKSLYVKVFGSFNEELFIIKREDIDTVDQRNGILSVIVDVNESVLSEFCDLHKDEAPHSISRLEFWVDDLFLHDLLLKKPILILNSKKEFSICYNFTYNFIGEKNE